PAACPLSLHDALPILVSVTERTREIGIRMAVDAKRWHILLQFLVEAVILSAMGGLIGIVTGIVGAQTASRFAGWPTIVPPESLEIGRAHVRTPVTSLP